MAAELNAKGALLSYHICGNATPIIADIVATGCPLIEVDQKADPRACKEAARGRALHQVLTLHEKVRGEKVKDWA
jgi:uroporphyrinogen-III decarboxylase